MKRPWAALAAVALLAGPAACSDDGPKEGEARLEVDGRALVERAGGERDTVEGGTNLHTGDRVSMKEGVAVMRLSGGNQLELRTGFDGGPADTTVLMGKRPVLEAGDLLVRTPDTVDLEADGTEVQVTDGAARLTRAFGMSVAAYDADVDLDSAGVRAEVPALRQMVVPDLGRPPQHARPIVYNDDDTWDRRYLGAAHALGVRLGNFAEALTSTLREGEGRTPGFFRLVLPGLDEEPAFDAQLLAAHLDRAPGETLIGTAITDLGERGSFATRWDDVFEFRDEGADWGIVALDQAVRSGPLVGSVEDALDSSFEDSAFVQPPSSTTPGTLPTATPEVPGGDPTTPGGTDDGSSAPPPPPPPPPGGPPPTAPGLPPITPDLPPPLQPVVEPITDLLNDLVDGLLGGLLDPGG